MAPIQLKACEADKRGLVCVVLLMSIYLLMLVMYYIYKKKNIYMHANVLNIDTVKSK